MVKPKGRLNKIWLIYNNAVLKWLDDIDDWIDLKIESMTTELEHLLLTDPNCRRAKLLSYLFKSQE